MGLLRKRSIPEHLVAILTGRCGKLMMHCNTLHHEIWGSPIGRPKQKLKTQVLGKLGLRHIRDISCQSG